VPCLCRNVSAADDCGRQPRRAKYYVTAEQAIHKVHGASLHARPPSSPSWRPACPYSLPTARIQNYREAVSFAPRCPAAKRATCGAAPSDWFPASWRTIRVQVRSMYCTFGSRQAVCQCSGIKKQASPASSVTPGRAPRELSNADDGGCCGATTWTKGAVNVPLPMVLW
jgi:hypothetical protein